MTLFHCQLLPGPSREYYTRINDPMCAHFYPQMVDDRSYYDHTYDDDCYWQIVQVDSVPDGAEIVEQSVAAERRELCLCAGAMGFQGDSAMDDLHSAWISSSVK